MDPKMEREPQRSLQGMAQEVARLKEEQQEIARKIEEKTFGLINEIVRQNRIELLQINWRRLLTSPRVRDKG